MAAKEYPVQILIYVTREQADAIHAMTDNVSKWVREKIEREMKRQARRKAGETTEAKS